MSIDTSLGLRLHRYVRQKVIILSVIRLLRPWIEELNTCMITYTAGEVLVWQPTDVTRTRTVRKSIFGFRLWRPRKQWAQRHEGVSSHDVPPRTDTADHGQSREHTAVSTIGTRNALSEIVFGCLNICSPLNKYDDVVDLWWRAALKTSGDVGHTRGIPLRWAMPSSQACCL